MAIASVVALTLGPDGPRDLASIHYLGQTLSLGRVDALSLVFAHVFAIQSLIGFIYALHVPDRGQHMVPPRPSVTPINSRAKSCVRGRLPSSPVMLTWMLPSPAWPKA